MKCKIHIPCSEYIEHDFEVNENYYNDSNSYANALKKNDELYGETIHNQMSLNGGFLSNSNSFHIGINAFDEKASKNEEKQHYTACEAFLYNEDFIDCSNKDLDDDDCAEFFIKFNYDDMNEDFEYELKEWVAETNKLKKLVESKQEASLNNEYDILPKRTLIVETNDCKHELYNCLITLYDNGVLAIMNYDRKKC